MQIECAKNVERSFMGTAPTLALIGQTYPSEQVNSWIMAHLVDLYKFVGVVEKLDMMQMKSLAAIIRTEYFYFKASELLLFFYKLKTGVYGQFYGVVDPMMITSALIEFSDWRRQKIELYERELRRIQAEKEREEWSRNAVTREEYEQMKKKRTMIQ